jgi:hypothetical protein
MRNKHVEKDRKWESILPYGALPFRGKSIS